MNNKYPKKLYPLILTLISLTAHADICHHEAMATNAYKEAVFFYPCDLSAPTPALTLTAGYGNTYRNLQWMTDAMVNAGYIVLAMSPIDIYGDVYQWKAAHINGQQTLITENNLSKSPLQGKIDIARRGISGFSMGGGGALLAGSELKSDVKVLATFAPFLKAEDRLKIQVSSPTLIIAGYRDLLVTNESIDEIYGYIQENKAASALAVYANGRHQQWYRKEITTNHDSYINLTLAWLDLHLKDDTSTIQVLSEMGSQVGHDNQLLKRYELNIQSKSE